MQAVAEAYRNLIATGARPLAATDNLNFGNPERPEIMGQFVGCIKGIGAACARARHADRVGQRQPLQRDRGPGDPADADDRRGRACSRSLDELIRMAPRDGRRAAAARRRPAGISASRRCLPKLFGREEGEAPPVDLARGTGGGRVRPGCEGGGLVSAAHDLSDGGLARGRGGDGAGGRRRRRDLRRRRARRGRLVLRRGPGALPARLPGGRRRPAAGAGASTRGCRSRVVGEARRRRGPARGEPGRRSRRSRPPHGGALDAVARLTLAGATGRGSNSA